MADGLVHEIAHRSWWDGTITSLCGQKRKPGTVTEHVFKTGASCPTCTKIRKNK